MQDAPVTPTEPQNSPPTETPTPDEKIDLGTPAADPPAADPPASDPPAEPPAAPDKGELYGAPEEGAAYDVKLDGDVQLDAAALEMATPMLRELNLSNAGANKLVGAFANQILPHYQEQFSKNLEEQILTTRTEWEGAARDLVKGKSASGEELLATNAAGEPLSFDGKTLAEVQSVAAKALDRIAPKGFREFLNETGLGVHPQMVAFVYQAGKALGEDQDFESGAVPKRELSREEKYYGSQ